MNNQINQDPLLEPFDEKDIEEIQKLNEQLPEDLTDEQMDKLAENIQKRQLMNEEKYVPKIREDSPFALQARDEREYQKILLELTPFQQKFVEAYVKVPNAAEAARCAGSTSQAPSVIGNQLLQKDKIQKAIAMGLRMRNLAAALDSTEVIQKLRTVFTLAIDSGKFDAANDAAKMLGECLGMFKTQTANSQRIQMNMVGNPGAGPVESVTIEGSLSQPIDEEERETLGRLQEIIKGVKTRL